MPTSGPYDVQSTAALTVVLQPNPHAAIRPSIKSYELRLFVTFADAAYAFSQGTINALLATHAGGAVDAPRRQGRAGGEHDHARFRRPHVQRARPGARRVRWYAMPSVSPSIARRSLQGRSAVTVVRSRRARSPPAFPGSDRPRSRQSRQPLRRRSLQANGWIPGADGIRQSGATRLAFTLAVPNINPLPVVAREVASQLATIGVHVTVDLVLPQTFLSGTLESGHFQLAIDSWNPVPGPGCQRVLALQRHPAARLQRIRRRAGPIPRCRPGHARRVARESNAGQRGSPGRSPYRGRRPGGLSVHAENLDGLPIAGPDRSDTLDRPGVSPLRRHCIVGDPLGVGTAVRR